MAVAPRPPPPLMRTSGGPMKRVSAASASGIATLATPLPAGRSSGALTVSVYWSVSSTAPPG